MPSSPSQQEQVSFSTVTSTYSLSCLSCKDTLQGQWWTVVIWPQALSLSHLRHTAHCPVTSTHPKSKRSKNHWKQSSSKSCAMFQDIHQSTKQFAYPVGHVNLIKRLSDRSLTCGSSQIARGLTFCLGLSWRNSGETSRRLLSLLLFLCPGEAELI